MERAPKLQTPKQAKELKSLEESLGILATPQQSFASTHSVVHPPICRSTIDSAAPPFPKELASIV